MKQYVSWNFFLFINKQFLEQFYVHSKNEWKIKRLPIHSLSPNPHPHTISPTIDILYHSGIFVIINELTLKHYYHSKSIVCIKFHSWCCTFYEF